MARSQSDDRGASSISRDFLALLPTSSTIPGLIVATFGGLATLPAAAAGLMIGGLLGTSGWLGIAGLFGTAALGIAGLAATGGFGGIAFSVLRAGPCPTPGEGGSGLRSK